MKNVILLDSRESPVAITNIMSETISTGFLPYLSLEDPQSTEPIPMPIIAIEIPIWVMDGVVLNSLIIEGIVGRYMSLTKEENAPIRAMKATNSA